jgi:hypothetical protein
MSATMTERDARKLAERVEATVAEEADVVERIADLRRDEEAAVQDALRAGGPTYGPGAKAEGIRRKREAAERKLTELREFTLPEARKLASEASEILRAAKVAHAREQARSFDGLEQEAVQRAAFAFEAFVRAYAALADAAQGREEILEELEQGDLLNGLREDERFRLMRCFESTMSPFPANALALFEALIPALCDPHAGSSDTDVAAFVAKANPVAAHFVELLAAAREERVWRGVHLRATDMVRSRS